MRQAALSRLMASCPGRLDRSLLPLLPRPGEESGSSDVSLPLELNCEVPLLSEEVPPSLLERDDAMSSTNRRLSCLDIDLVLSCRGPNINSLSSEFIVYHRAPDGLMKAARPLLLFGDTKSSPSSFASSSSLVLFRWVSNHFCLRTSFVTVGRSVWSFLPKRCLA